MSEKGRKIYNGITNIDDDLIMAALEAKPAAKKKKSAKVYIYTWGAAAAAVIALAVVGIIVVPMMSKNMSDTTATNATGAYFAADSTATASDSVCEATTSDYGIKDSEESCDVANFDMESPDYSDASAESDSTNTAPTVSLEDLGENQILLSVDYDEVEEVTLSYPGYDTVVIEDSVASQMVDLINSMGVLTIKDDYNDVTTENYATIELAMADGSDIEITPKYPYIFIDGEVYECESKSRGIYNLALYINEFCSTYFGKEE